MKIPPLPSLWNIACGLMDTLTGILLIAAPIPLARILGIALSPSAAPYLAWIGAFVASTGLAYALPLLNRRWLPPVWLITGTTRALVAGFLSFQILSNHLPAAWLTVAITDALVAAIQFITLPILLNQETHEPL